MLARQPPTTPPQHSWLFIRSCSASMHTERQNKESVSTLDPSNARQPPTTHHTTTTLLALYSTLLRIYVQLSGGTKTVLVSSDASLLVEARKGQVVKGVWVRKEGVRVGRRQKGPARVCTAYLVVVHAAQKTTLSSLSCWCCLYSLLDSSLPPSLTLLLITAILIAPTTLSKERDTASACLFNLALVLAWHAWLAWLAGIFSWALALAWLAISQLPLLCASEGQKKGKVVQSTPRAGCKLWYSTSTSPHEEKCLEGANCSDSDLSPTLLSVGRSELPLYAAK
ncbi:MAG: hypothetical protein J3Q66DRAFT_336951 [Benniella sp.]|nr:MAG: hypothetical protein J3Q66DRAFT_336951 [Benniella sp.]